MTRKAKGRMRLRLSKRVIAFYRRVAREAQLPMSTVITVFMAVYVVVERMKKRKERRRG